MPTTYHLSSILKTAVAPLSEPTKPDSVIPSPSARLGERLGIPSSRSRLVAHARRLGLRDTWDMEKLFLARGFRLPGENVSGTLFTESVTSVVFTDTELTALLLSPCLEMNARVICRGALLLAAQLAVVAPESIVYEVRRARGETVVRHVAWLGCEVYPKDRRWRDLLRLLPSVRVIPAFAPGIMPDEEIWHALTRS